MREVSVLDPWCMNIRNTWNQRSMREKSRHRRCWRTAWNNLKFSVFCKQRGNPRETEARVRLRPSDDNVNGLHLHAIITTGSRPVHRLRASCDDYKLGTNFIQNIHRLRVSGWYRRIKVSKKLCLKFENVYFNCYTFPYVIWFGRELQLV